MHGQAPGEGDAKLKNLLGQASQPDLIAWLQRNEERARRLTPAEIEELLAMQGEAGPLAALGVERVIELLERKRELIRRVYAVAGSEYLGLLEQIVALLYDRVKPTEAG
jgi:hypothetical protein